MAERGGDATVIAKGGSIDPIRFELARDSDAVDFARFTSGLGLHTSRRGMTVEIFDATDVIGGAVTQWLADWHEVSAVEIGPGGKEERW